MTGEQRLYGKFRGVVVDSADPLAQGRLLVRAPEATGPDAAWAMPCVPVAGPQAGMVALPAIGAGVWVEFEQGDPGSPIWTGSFWGPGELPVLALATPPGVASIILQTPLGNGITISDLPGPTGGIVLRSASGATVVINDTGIRLENGKGAVIELVGPTVTVNNDAFTVV